MYKNIPSFLLLVLVALLMNSCFGKTGTHVTPQMDFSAMFVNPQIKNDSVIGAKDTLFATYKEELEYLYMDTMQLGDTVMFIGRFVSYPNHLVSVKAAYDSVRVHAWFNVDIHDEKQKQYFAADSQPEKGFLHFNPIVDFVMFSTYIVPQEAGSHTIKMTVMSDSEFSTNSLTFVLPVK